MSFNQKTKNPEVPKKSDKHQNQYYTVIPYSRVIIKMSKVNGSGLDTKGDVNVSGC
jgi:hypothetical protein